MGNTLLTAQRTSSRWIVPLVLIAPVVAIFAPVLFTDRSFAFRDGAHFYHPLFQWIAQEWGQGRIPLWNPQENCGLPVLADATSSIFYPGKLIFLLPLPFAWLYKLYIIGHVLLAAAAMYAFARRLQASEQAAALAAIAYACGGNVVFQYCNIVFLVGAAWLPAALLAIEVIATCRCWRAMIFFAFVLAMMILGGDPQMAYHALLVAGLRLVCAWFNSSSSLTSEPREAGRSERLRSLLYPAVLFAGAAVFAFALAAVQILPSSEAAKSSERVAYSRPRNLFEAVAIAAKPADASLLAETPSEKITAGIFGQPEPTSHHDRAYDFSISPWRAIEFLWPNVSGRPFPVNQRWLSRVPAEAKPWTPSLYLGLFPLLVGVAALRLWKTDATTRWLSWLVLIFALGSLGWYGLGWLARESYATLLQGDSSKLGIGAPVGGVYWLMVTLLPTYIYFRYPAKLMVVAVCGLCAAAAPAADRMFATKSTAWRFTWQWFAVLSLLLAFAVWCASPWLMDAKPFPSKVFGPFDTRGAIVGAITALLHAAVVAGLVCWILGKVWDTLTTKQAAENMARWKWAVVALTALELVIANGWMIFTAPAQLWEDQSPAVAAIEQYEQTLPAAQRSVQPRFFRGSYSKWTPPSFGVAPSPQRLEEMAHWDHDTLSHKYFLPSHWQTVESYGSLKSLDYESLLLTARTLSPTEVDGTRLPAAEALRLTSCEYLVLPASAQVAFAEKLTPPEGITLAENVSLWKMKRTLPRTWVVSHVVQLPPLADQLDINAVDQRSREVLTEQHEGKLATRDFRRVAVVETSEKLPAVLQELNEQDPAATAAVITDQPQHVTIRANLSQPGLLVLADSFSVGWTARYEPAADSPSPSTSASTPTPIHRTNRCFRGIELPAGDWLVHFEYRPQSFYRGATVSVLAWLGLFVACAIGWNRRSASIL